MIWITVKVRINTDLTFVRYVGVTIGEYAKNFSDKIDRGQEIAEVSLLH